MTLFIWAAIAVVVLVSALLIYLEHEWGFVLGGSTTVILVVSYFSVEFIMSTPLAALLPHISRLDAMAITAGALLVLVLIAIAYLAGRSSAADKKR